MSRNSSQLQQEVYLLSIFYKRLVDLSINLALVISLHLRINFVVEVKIPGKKSQKKSLTERTRVYVGLTSESVEINKRDTRQLFYIEYSH